MAVKIAGTGSYLPMRVLTNHELSERVETSDEWIRQRVGIVERRIASSSETGAYISSQAAQKALEAAGIPPGSIGLIIVATATADDRMPSTACAVQAALNIPDCIAFDLGAACSGFVYALGVARSLMEVQSVQHALVIGADRLSRLVDWADRSTCVLFGDGAGAVVLSRCEKPGIEAVYLHSAGQHRDLLYATGSLSNHPFEEPLEPSRLSMEGNKVFKYAVTALEEVVLEMLEKNHLQCGDIDWLIPHQANERILTATTKKLGIPEDRVILTLAHHGNTSAASVPLALDTAVRDGRIQRGNRLLLEAFGAGFVWGAVLVTY